MADPDKKIWAVLEAMHRQKGRSEREKAVVNAANTDLTEADDTIGDPDKKRRAVLAAIRRQKERSERKKAVANAVNTELWGVARK